MTKKGKMIIKKGCFGG